MDPNNLTPQQQQAIMMRAQQEANQQIMQSMLEGMVKTCFSKCAGTSVRFRVALVKFENVGWVHFEKGCI